MTRVLLWAAVVACFARMATAADPCETRAAKKNEEFAKSGPHSFLASVQHKQEVELAQTWCRIFETTGIDRVQKGIDFGRVLFTGDGLHPTVGGIVPGSGFAGGLVYNLERATSKPAIRYSASAEARGSYNGFWEAGGRLDIFGAASSPQNRRVSATLEALHLNLPEMTYFGEGNGSLLVNESLYGLVQTTGGGHLNVPLIGGLALVGGLAGLWNAPSGIHGASLPSIEQNFSAANTPALAAGTAYVVTGGGIRWTYPTAPRMNGFGSQLLADFRFFHEATGAPYSFRRLDAVWINRYSPPTQVDLGTISGTVRFVEAYATGGNQMPFYLQPTIGGNDINSVDMLRSYRDYRFRAPNLLVLQAEYTHAVWGPLSVLGFYDTGRVAAKRADIGFSQLHHSFGAGLVVQLGAAPLLKFYYAWGGPEGSHTTYTTNTNNFTLGAPAGVF